MAPGIVYVVDDDANVRDAMAFLLRSHQFSCKAFEDGDALLNEIQGLKPGCILLDIVMPGSSGIDVQKELTRRGSKLPVITMTGTDNAETDHQSLELGAVDILHKPFEAEQLLSAIRTGFARLDSAHA